MTPDNEVVLAELQNVKDRVAEHQADSLRWRESHCDAQDATFARFGKAQEGLAADIRELRDDLAKRWPVGATVAITVLGTIMGIAVGVAGATVNYADELRQLVIAIQRLVK